MSAHAHQLAIEEPRPVPTLQPAPRRPKLKPAMLRFLRLLRLAVWRAFQHDAFSIAKASAYSSILTFFPALLIVGSVLATWRKGAPFMREITYALSRILPTGANTRIELSCAARLRVLLECCLLPRLITLWTASGVMVSWMEGFRRCYELPKIWGLVKERLIAFWPGHLCARSHDLRHAAGRVRQQDRSRHPLLHRPRIQPLHPALSGPSCAGSSPSSPASPSSPSSITLPSRAPNPGTVFFPAPPSPPAYGFLRRCFSDGIYATTPITASFTARSALLSPSWSGCT